MEEFWKTDTVASDQPDNFWEADNPIGTPPADDFDKWMQANIDVESQGRYDAVGLPIDRGMNKGWEALGKYQIMPNLHFHKIGLDPYNRGDRERYLSNPELQDSLAQIVYREFWDRAGGDPRKATAYKYGRGDDAEITTAGGQRMPTGAEHWNLVSKAMGASEPEPAENFWEQDAPVSQDEVVEPEPPRVTPATSANPFMQGQVPSPAEPKQSVIGAGDVAKGLGKGFVDIPKTAIEGLASGLDRVGMSLGSIIEYGGEKVDSQNLSKLGKKIHSIYKERPAIKEGMPEDIEGSVAEKPELLLDPKWWAYNVSQMAPSLAVALGPGLVAGGTITAAGTGLKLTPKLVGRLATLGTSITAGGVGGALEGSSTYQEMKEKGASEEEAQTAAEMMAGMSAALNAISFGRMLSKSPKMGTTMKRTISGATEAITEWLEEPAEVVAKRTPTGEIKDIPGTVKEAVEAIKDGMNVVGPSFLLGFAGGGNISVQEEKTVEKEIKTETQEEDFFTQDEVVSEGEPITEEEAVRQMGGKMESKPSTGMSIQEDLDQAFSARAKHDFKQMGIKVPTRKQMQAYWENLTDQKISREAARDLIKNVYGATPEALADQSDTAQEDYASQFSIAPEEKSKGPGRVEDIFEMTPEEKKELLDVLDREKARQDKLKDETKKTADMLEETLYKGPERRQEEEWDYKSPERRGQRQEKEDVSAEVIESIKKDYKELTGEKISDEKAAEFARKHEKPAPKKVEKKPEITEKEPVAKKPGDQPSKSDGPKKGELIREGLGKIDKGPDEVTSFSIGTDSQATQMKAVRTKRLTKEILKKVSPELQENVRVHFGEYYRYYNTKFKKSMMGRFGEREEAFVMTNKTTGETDVYVNPRVNKNRMEHVLVHEMMGHYGSNAVLASNPKIKKRVDALFDNDQGSKFMDDIDRRWGKIFDKNKDPNKRESARKSEWIAERMAEHVKGTAKTSRDKNIAKRVYEAVRQFLVDTFKIDTGRVDDVMRQMVKQMKTVQPTETGQWFSKEESKKVTGSPNFKNVVFDPTQIKSATGNRGTFSPTDPDIRFSIAPQEGLDESIYEENRKTASKKITPPIAAKVGKGLEKVFTPISTRLKNMDQTLYNAMRKHEYVVINNTKRDLNAVKPFLELKKKKMSKEDFTDFDLAEKNRDMTKINELVTKYGLEKEYQAKRDVLEKLYEAENKAGFEVNYLENFAPRHVKNLEGLLNYFRGTDRWSEIQNKINEETKKLNEKNANAGKPQRSLTTPEIADIVNKILRGYQQGKITLSKPGQLKERRVKLIDAKINQYYSHSDAALTLYIDRINTAIAAREFFGKSTVMTESGGIDIDETIGQHTALLIAEGKINYKQEQELQEILRARFNPGRTGELVSLFKNIEYIDTMGSPISAITQIGDLGFAVYNSGILNTVASAFGKNKINVEDILGDKIAQEFSESSRSARALNAVFRATGLAAMDQFGKNVLINGEYRKIRSMARKSPSKLIEELTPVFEGEAANVVKEIQSGKITENVKLHLFNKLLDFQPVALSEMPEQYLKSGNGKVFYMLKSYTIRQFDTYRRETITEFNKGNKKKAMLNMVKLTGAIVAANGTADLIKNFLLGRYRDIDDLIGQWDDVVIDNILRIAGFSKFMLWRFREGDVGQSIASLVWPPLKVVNSAALDLRNLWMDEGKGLEITSSIPLGGKFYYWWFGRGSEKVEARRTRRKWRKYYDLRKVKNRYNKLVDRVDESENKAEKAGRRRKALAYRRKHIQELRYLTRAEGLKKNYSRISKLADKAKTTKSQIAMEKRMDKILHQFQKEIDKKGF